MSSLNDEVPLSLFERQLDWLESRYRLVTLEEALACSSGGGTRGRARACLTFDDGLQSVFECVRPILAARGVPAAVFLNTATIGNRTLLWQHALSYLMERHGVSEVYRRLSDYTGWTGTTPKSGNAVIQVCQHNFSDIWRSNAMTRVIDDLGLDVARVARTEALYLEPQQIAAMTQQGFSFYSHTSSHLPLAHVDEPTMRNEIDRAREQLRCYPGTSERCISFPFGMWRDFGGRTHEYALKEGYLVLHVEDGWNPAWRVRRSHTLRRVGLGGQRDNVHLYADIEVRPLLKGVMGIAAGQWRRA
jgi:peptidoglycan/xylan/chitin deacetylase (PgdA/CDA1 family)